MTSRSFEQIIAEQVSEADFALPVSGNVALQLRQKVDSDVFEMEDIEDMILRDPGLASSVLRIANGALYSGLSEIGTIRKAIMRLGADQVVSVSMMAAQRQVYDTKDRMLQGIMQKLWTHASVSSIGCRWVARRAGMAELAENAFLAGLLHDLGQVVLMRVFDRVIASGEGAMFTEDIILEILESPLHCKFGAEIIERWKLPSIYKTVTAEHHDAELASKADPILLATRLIDQICWSMGLGLRGGEGVQPESSKEADSLMLSEIQVAELQIELEDTISAHASI